MGDEMTRVEKPWGYELHWAKTDRYVGKLIHVNAGHALSLQPGESVHITPKTVHRMTAIVDSDIFEVSTPELHDVVRLEDRYGRTDKKSSNVEVKS